MATQVTASWVIGDLVDITLPEDETVEGGREWVDGRVGMLKQLAHVRDFANLGGDLTPEVDMDHFIVSVDHDKAKGEYALARVHVGWMQEHTCNGSCPTVHPCRLG